MDLKKMSAGQIAAAVNKGELKARELTETLLDKCAAINSNLNIFSCLAGDAALEQAETVDQKSKNGLRLLLAGVPLTVKDDLMYRALPAGLGSAAFNAFYPPCNAAAVEKLIAAGAIVIGKTNLDNMGIGSTTLEAQCGPTLNPWQPERVAGSAGQAAVAAGLCALALESDSGGALLHGASYCGTFGLRPTGGLVSRHGLAMHSGSFGRVGLAAAFPEDLVLALRVVSGFDPRDAATAVYRDRGMREASPVDLADLTIGFPPSVSKLLAESHLETVDNASKLFEGRGARIVEVNIECFEEALRAYHVIAAAEASSTLSRFDGIRFGTATVAANLEEYYSKARRAAFNRETIRRIIFGTYLLSKDGYESYYRQALKLWNLVRSEFKAALESCDLLLLPATRSLPPVASEAPDFLQLYTDDIFTAPVSLAGLPALSVPAGRINGLPVGVQLVAPEFKEEQLLSVAVKMAPHFKFTQPDSRGED